MKNDSNYNAMEKKIISNWTAPHLPENTPFGDMPGDSIKVSEEHISKAGVIFPILLQNLTEIKSKEDRAEGLRKVVVSVYGGSGVGKSETASILSYYLNEAGIGSYIMSGDNYSHRIPKYNDMERLRIYEEGGEDALRAYLGSEMEINFKEVNEIIRLFKNGEQKIYLRRMGRSETELWYERVNFGTVEVLVLEWTHGNSACLRGVDIPIFLASTPAETLAHRLARNRDSAPDSPFVTMVLGIEQDKLISQARSAKILISKQGEVITAEEYLEKVGKDRK